MKWKRKTKSKCGQKSIRRTRVFKKKSTNSSSDNLKRKQLHDTLVVVIVVVRVVVVVGVCLFFVFFFFSDVVHTWVSLFVVSSFKCIHTKCGISISLYRQTVVFFFVFSLSYLNWFLVSQALLWTNVWHTRTIAWLDVMSHSVLVGGHTRWKCQIFFGVLFFSLHFYYLKNLTPLFSFYFFLFSLLIVFILLLLSLVYLFKCQAIGVVCMCHCVAIWKWNEYEISKFLFFDHKNETKIHEKTCQQFFWFVFNLTVQSRQFGGCLAIFFVTRNFNRFSKFKLIKTRYFNKSSQ